MLIAANMRLVRLILTLPLSRRSTGAFTLVYFMNMKFFTPFLFAAILSAGYFAQPQPAQALSCLDPVSSIEFYTAADSQAIIVTAEVLNTDGELTATGSDDPNEQFVAGAVTQTVAISAVHQGAAPEQLTVSFTVDPTWGYLCAGAPPADDTTQVYVLRSGDTPDEYLVSNVFADDSDLAKDLIAATNGDSTGGTLNVTIDTPAQYQTKQLLEQIELLQKIVMLLEQLLDLKNT